MQAADTELPATEPSRLRRHWAILTAVLALLAVILLTILNADLRALAADTWREMRAIPPLYLLLILGFKTLQTLFSALTWRNALLAAWPGTRLPYRFVLGIDQGQDVLNTVTPARAGTWTMLGIFAFSIRGARAPKLLAVWAVQSLAFGLFAAINYTIVAIGLPNHARERGNLTDRIATFVSERPLISALIAALTVGLLVFAAVKGRRSLRETRQQVREGFAILGSPSRYLRLLFLPSLASYSCRCASHITLLAAFGIPVSIWTITLALSAQSVAGAVRVTPGGIGTTQAIDVIALRDYAAPEVVTAYSLSELALSAIVSFSVAIVALFSAYGWHGTVRIVRHRKRSVLLAPGRQAVQSGKSSVDG